MISRCDVWARACFVAPTAESKEHTRSLVHQYTTNRHRKDSWSGQDPHTHTHTDTQTHGRANRYSHMPGHSPTHTSIHTCTPLPAGTPVQKTDTNTQTEVCRQALVPRHTNTYKHRLRERERESDLRESDLRESDLRERDLRERERVREREGERERERGRERERERQRQRQRQGQRQRQRRSNRHRQIKERHPRMCTGKDMHAET